MTELGAARDVRRNLSAGSGPGEPVVGAEITASAFRLARVAPLLGRALVADDERLGAPPVVVLGHGVWRTRFGSDPTVVGRAVRLGGDYATVVGVMPEGFAFPESHEVWVPLRLRPADQPPRAGPAVRVFGRLAPGTTLAAAQAELATLGRRAAVERPDTHARLRPRVVPYATTFVRISAQEMRMLLSINVVIVLLLVLVCGNVALLLFARAATRETELTVRSALGAGRGRLVAQLFAEALVLGGVSAAVGLAAARVGLRWGLEFLEANLGRLPFWFSPRLSLTAVLYAVGLTALAALLAGVVPALKVTRGLGARLRQGTAGGGIRFGGVWTAVIVAQVAFTVAFPALVVVEQREIRRTQSFDVGFADEEFLTAKLETDAPSGTGTGTGAGATAATLDALRRRLAAEPGVTGVTFARRLPRTFYTRSRIEIEGVGETPPSAPRAALAASTAFVDPSYFDVLEMPILAGRGFRPLDATSNAPVAVVNQLFVDEALRGQSPVGRRFRVAESVVRDGKVVDEWSAWQEIVGVVRGLDVTERYSPAPGVYFATTPGGVDPSYLLVHARGDPLALAPRVREVAEAVDPALRLSDVQRLDEVENVVLRLLGQFLRVTVTLCAVALVLSLAGIYAVLAFTVARRTREIGVRVALGASRRRVVAAIFRRPLAQVGAGVVVGGSLIAVVAIAASDGALSPRHVALLVVYAAFMLGVCLLACVVPTRRALAVEPTEALREE